jgi:Glycosyl transferases group 1
MAIAPARQRPRIVDACVGKPEPRGATCLIVCAPGFDQNSQQADVTIRLGYARGFQAMGVRAKLVDGRNLECEIANTQTPFVFLSIYEYEYLPSNVLRRLKSTPHFVWVNPWSKAYRRLRERHPTMDLLPDSLCRRVAACDPRFVWAPVGSRGRELYSGWQRAGVHFETLHLACDDSVYYPDVTDAGDFEDTMLAFVGTYNQVKYPAFKEYLWPYEASLAVYGRTPWPYSGYRGPLARSRERVLYGKARLCPSVNSPACYDGWDEVNERAYKVMGSGGLTATDPVAAYRELFGNDELLTAATAKEYHGNVTWLLENPDVAEDYRRAGLRAVLARHTYTHRAEAVLALLGVGTGVSPPQSWTHRGPTP